MDSRSTPCALPLKIDELKRCHPDVLGELAGIDHLRARA